MIILEWTWNHANLSGPRPIDGFCLVNPPTQIIWIPFPIDKQAPLEMYAGKYHV